MDLKDRVAVVTGGNRGIGRAISLALADKGAKVAIIYGSSAAAAADVKNEIISNKGEALTIQADVSKKPEVAEAFRAAIEHFRKIDILVNNAGTMGTPNFLEITEEDWDRVLAVNLKSMFNCCQEAVPAFLQQGSGRIVNLSSIAGKMGGKSGVHYAAAKAGVIGLTMALATEFSDKNILVNAVAPGPVRTEMLDKLPQELQKIFADLTLVKRVCEPAEIAHGVIFLLENDFVTGETLNISGGRYLD
jgi:3-oxoacyl-[acyl-carrier protein] reductase